MRSMEIFNEKVHACIAGLFYREMLRYDPFFAREAFVQGTRKHGESRGRRMAQRALNDGEVLDFRTYFRYREWQPSEYYRSLHLPSSRSERGERDYVITIPACLWHEQFKEMELPEAEEIYCAEIDRAIVRGFNPQLHFETVQTLARCDSCIQKAYGAAIRQEDDLSVKEEYIRDFAFHCANSFYAYEKAAQKFFPEKASAISAAVQEGLKQLYGQEALSALERYKGYDFDRIGEDRNE